MSAADSELQRADELIGLHTSERVTSNTLLQLKNRDVLAQVLIGGIQKVYRVVYFRPIYLRDLSSLVRAISGS